VSTTAIALPDRAVLADLFPAASRVRVKIALLLPAGRKPVHRAG